MREKQEKDNLLEENKKILKNLNAKKQPIKKEIADLTVEITQIQRKIAVLTAELRLLKIRLQGEEVNSLKDDIRNDIEAKKSAIALNTVKKDEFKRRKKNLSCKEKEINEEQKGIRKSMEFLKKKGKSSN